MVKGDPASQGKKADVSLSLSDEDFGKMVGGKTQAQRLFMSGKLKIKGDVMKVRFLGFFSLFLLLMREGLVLGIWMDLLREERGRLKQGGGLFKVARC